MEKHGGSNTPIMNYLYDSLTMDNELIPGEISRHGLWRASEFSYALKI